VNRSPGSFGFERVEMKELAEVKRTSTKIRGVTNTIATTMATKKATLYRISPEYTS